MSGADIGAVVIGRNEGERLRACLASLRDVPARVYVDSGSTDDSCELARFAGFAVVDLDMTIPFSAARARNAGIEWLTERHSGLAFIQTVDGDCEVREGWIDKARSDLDTDPRRAVAFGRRRERDPHRNAYHLASDDEWSVPLGEVGSCGGDALLRVAALREVGGYNPTLIAGEEPDMCLRLRAKGWRIWSNGQEMTWHDIDLHRMSQWWQRAMRAGFAFAELVDLHGERADPSWRRLVRSAIGWTAINSAILPAIVIAALFPHPAVVVLAGLPLALSLIQILRMARSKRHFGWRGALQWAGLMMIAKAAQVRGWLQYRSQALTHRRATLIEYKR
jgi:GT2 family glycosyltransferase